MLKQLCTVHAKITIHLSVGESTTINLHFGE